MEPSSQPSTPPVAQAAPATPDGMSSAEASAKAFLAQTITQVEAAFAATATKPHLRAVEIQRIKSEYLKTKYNVEIKTAVRG